MSDQRPSALLDACVVVGASNDKLLDICQQVTDNNGTPERHLLEPEVLHIFAPPFLNWAQADNEARSHGRRAFLKKKRKAETQLSAVTSERKGGTEDISVPKDIDLTVLPQLCFPGIICLFIKRVALLINRPQCHRPNIWLRFPLPDGLQVTREHTQEQFHFLVFTDVFGHRSHGVVMRCSRPILGTCSELENGHGPSKCSHLHSSYSFCVISKYPYFNALKDCLSCLLVQLTTCRLSEMEGRVREFAAKLSVVPIPPPGQLHLTFTFHPLTIYLPSGEDRDHPAVDLDLHLPFLCFRPQALLQVLSCLLQEQRVVLFSANWARLTLVAESLLLFLKPLSWQQPYVPVLARSMLDFVMAPTAFLMGCHLSHFEEVATETDDLILINIDNGHVSTSCSETVDLPEIPAPAADCFSHRCQALQKHFDLDQCHHATCTHIDDHRAQKRTWQRRLNHDIQRIALELMVNIFRDVSCHLNYEHRVFNSEEFLASREPSEQLFYKNVLETHIFHSFLKDRLNRKMDHYSRLELGTRSEMQKMKAKVEIPRRPTMQEIQARRRSLGTDSTSAKRMGAILPNLGEEPTLGIKRNSLTGVLVSDTALKTPLKPVKVFQLPDFPPSLSFTSVQSYYSELIQRLSEAIAFFQNENSTLLARFYYLRGFINWLCSRRLDALSDFQTLYKTDTAIFPTQLVTWLADSLHQDERQQADAVPELKRLILKVKIEKEKSSAEPDDHVKKFELPRKSLDQEQFVRCIQECGIVQDVATIHRLFDALTHGQTKQVEPELFKRFYTFWKVTESEAQDFNLPSEVVDHLDNSECVYKLSSWVKTSHGVGKIAMTQKRLFLLTEGKPGFVEITKFRDIQEVKVASFPFLLVRIPSLRILTASPLEVFEANLKSETELWNLLILEMWAGRKMADQHKDPQYVTQALTNVLLMDAVTGSLLSPRAVSTASKLSYLHTIKHQVPMMMPKTTSETLKHKINPSLDLAEPQTVHLLLYTPGQLTCLDSDMVVNPMLWVALSGGRVVVFDATCWSKLQDCIQVGESQLNCMLGLVGNQVWLGSQDSVIYIIDTLSMSCNKQLTEHRQEVTGLTRGTGDVPSGQVFSCSCDGTVLQWDSSSLEVRRQFQLSCERLTSVQIHDGRLWCCCGDCILELKKNGTPQRRMVPPDSHWNMHGCFSSFIVFPERGQLWTGSADSHELLVWLTNGNKQCFKKVSLPGISGVTCMIRVKDQIWVGCCGGQKDCPQRSQVMVLDPETLSVAKELQAHSDRIQTLCSAEDRYVLSGSARYDGRIAIWKVE
ncbi:DENN domain-containing protein 3-like isoform X2 [Synchiropus splendidus]|uniref:DENN domain-containing protein 3-like isoform X2 n=1 Tax=Synchiropus splendidus TaxID=270530 RepID=UPI00237DB0DA|nr:DENN domain-containing protein 3-like isoform X2 [Synchiropus splendidus]